MTQIGSPRVRLVAFYLPQFHPIPENDSWWGRGFTEWTNVTKARPLFSGHYQPHLPADLGFYDLRLPEARQAQADLAAAHGLDAFCYYHYWFGGKQLLERPFAEVLKSGEPSFPFCLCWANESWSRRWLGEDQAILMRQTYSSDDDLAHARWLVRAFADARYLTVGGRPLFLVYRPADLPQPERTMDLLRSECVRHGLAEPYLVGVDSHSPGVDFRTRGFDSTLVFQPQLGVLPDFMEDGFKVSKLRRNWRFGVFSGRLKLYSYAASYRLMMQLRRDFPFIQTVFVGWDNTPRRSENAIVVVESRPGDFGRNLADAIGSAADAPGHERLVFVNAWNEWAEGNHLEPDQRHGLDYLKEIKRLTSENQPAAVRHA
jgi:lipopolysaccharide biosynthesis protein